MAVCTRGQRSLTWNQWPVQTRAPGTARSPTTGSRTARGWISALQVGRSPLPSICNKGRSGWKRLVLLSEPAPVTPRAGSKEPTCKDCGFSSRLFDRADCRLDVSLTVLLLEQVGPALRLCPRRCCCWDSAGGCGSWSESAAWLLLSWCSSSFTCAREFKERK